MTKIFCRTPFAFAYSLWHIAYSILALSRHSGLLPTGLGADAACAVRSFSVRSLQGSCFPCLLAEALASCLNPETRPLGVPLPKCYRALAEKQRAYLRLEPHHVMRERYTRRSLSAEKQPQPQTSAGHTAVSEKPCPTKNRQHPLFKYLEKMTKNGNTCHCEALRRLYLNRVSKNGQKYSF